MRKLLGLVLLLNLSGLGAPAAFALSDTGKAFELEGAQGTPLFFYKKDVDVKGETEIFTSTYADAAGKALVIETSEFAKNGERLIVKSYKISQKQLGAEGAVEVKDGKAHFTYMRDGKTKTSDEKVGDDFIVGPSIVNYIQSNWSTITAGKKIKGRLAVADRLETVGFEYFKDGEEDVKGEKAVVVKMKPSSFIIAALVNPLYFYISNDGKRLLQMKGRTQVKRQDGSKWKDLDALTVYDTAK